MAAVTTKTLAGKYHRLTDSARPELEEELQRVRRLLRVERVDLRPRLVAARGGAHCRHGRVRRAEEQRAEDGGESRRAEPVVRLAGEQVPQVVHEQDQRVLKDHSQ